MILLRLAIGQAEKCEAIRLRDDPCLCLSQKRLYRRTARRAGYKIGSIIKKVDGKRAFANKLAFVRRAPVPADEDQVGIRFADRNLTWRLNTSSHEKRRRQDSKGCRKPLEAN